MEGRSIAELLAFLRSSFRQADFDRVGKILAEREESVAAAVKSSFSEALALKEVEKIELEAECEVLQKELEAVRSQSAQLEERAGKAEDGLRVLSAERERKQREASAVLEVKVVGLALEKSVAVGEAEKYKNLCRKLEEQVLMVEEERKVAPLREREALGRIEEMKKREQESTEKILQLQEEIGNLECARRRAEAEVFEWKRKYGDLEAQSLRLVEENLSLKAKARGMSQKIKCESGSNLPAKQNRGEVYEGPKKLQIPKLDVEDSDGKVDGAVRSRAGPATEAVIEIVDSEDEMETKDYGCLKQSMAGTLGDIGDMDARKLSNELHLDLRSDGATLAENTSFKENAPSTSTPKRKRAWRVVMSDSESGKDDNVIAKEEVNKNRIDETEGSLSSPGKCSPGNSSNDDGQQELMTPSRRRLVPLSQCRQVKDTRVGVSPRQSAASTAAVLLSASRGSAVARDKGTVFRKMQCPVAENVSDHEVHRDDDVESVESNSEGESLGGFIVNESNSSDNGCSSSDASEREVSSDSLVDPSFARIHREKRGVKWVYEADMLASFGKDPVICMKAVCALYRQQTADEQSVKGTLFTNKRGFSRLDARRGSSIADFLTDGNPEGPLTKSVKDLQKYDHTGVEYCCKLAAHYSKQLFAIYQNREDPHFLPN